jgi:hypothetical protein
MAGQLTALEEKLVRTVPLKLSGMCAGYFQAAVKIDTTLANQGGKPANSNIKSASSWNSTLFTLAVLKQDPNHSSMWADYMVKYQNIAMEMDPILLGKKMGWCGGEIRKYM